MKSEPIYLLWNQRTQKKSLIPTKKLQLGWSKYFGKITSVMLGACRSVHTKPWQRHRTSLWRLRFRTWKKKSLCWSSPRCAGSAFTTWQTRLWTSAFRLLKTSKVTASSPKSSLAVFSSCRRSLSRISWFSYSQNHAVSFMSQVSRSTIQLTKKWWPTARLSQNLQSNTIDDKKFN